jgi:predicted phage terminase large subunit-like protein
MTRLHRLCEPSQRAGANMQSPEASLFGRLADSLTNDWRGTARPNQLPPAGAWTVWLILAGRGWGKTRVGAEWVRAQVMAGKRRLAIVAPTAADGRDIMVEGESGILSISPDHDRPSYEPSKRRLTWANGAIATVFSADEPDRLRGPQYDGAWCDEIAAWKYIDAWDMLQFGLRLGKDPRCVVTTTPRPIKIIRDLLGREGDNVAVTRGSTYENRSNLAPSFFSQIVSRYEGTRLGRQELQAEVLEDTPGALWKRVWLDRDRVSAAPAEMKRIVVSVDPAVSNNEGSDETGILCCGLGNDGHAYVLDDLSGRFAPNEWAGRAVDAFHRWKADRIVAEINQGGLMVENTIRTIDASVPYRGVHASRGKVVRAEPISALSEQGKVHLVGSFPILEDQMAGFTSDFDRNRAGYSPDRVDALVWALSELMLGYQVQPLAITMPFYTGVSPSVPGSDFGSSRNPALSYGEEYR